MSEHRFAQDDDPHPVQHPHRSCQRWINSDRYRLTVGVRCFTEAKILEEGATTLPAKRLAQLVRELTSANLEVITHPNEVTEIVSDASRFKLNGMNKSEFPSLPSVVGASHFKVSQADLKDMFFRTAFAVSREDNRYVLTGVYLHIANGDAIFVGTDGKRLARAHIKINLDPTFTASYIIPLKAVEEMMKNLSDEGEATVYLMSDKIAVEASNTMIVTKLLSGDYPDINRVIPENSEAVVTLHREELMTLLRQVALFTTDTNHSVRFTFWGWRAPFNSEHHGNRRRQGEHAGQLPRPQTRSRLQPRISSSTSCATAKAKQ